VYAFSTENWKRNKREVDALMKLLRTYMKTRLKRAMETNMRVRVIGDLSMLSPDIQESIQNIEEQTKHNSGLQFIIAINYGSRDEIVRAVRKISQAAVDGVIQVGDIKEDTFATHLDTADIPDPDLLIRTSGEIRLSNYLLWQLAYAEFYFTEVLWPDFDKEELKKAIEFYNRRERRFGAVFDE